MARNDVEIRVGANTGPAEAAFGKLRASIGGFAAGLVGTAGLAVALTSSSRAAGDFETAMAEVSTLLDDTSGVDALTLSVKELAKEYGSSPTEQAKALYQIISSGAAEAGKETDLLTAANKLAVGGITDVETAAGGLTAIIKGYGLATEDAGRVSDVLFAAMKAGRTTIGELAANFGNVGSLAKTAGISLEETAAATSTLTTQGISTSQAVTQLRGVIQSVIKPTGEAAQLAKDLGLEFNAEALAAKGLTGFLADVAAKTDGNSAQAAKLFGNLEGLQGVLALAGTQAGAFATTLDSVRESAGQTDEAVSKIAGTSDFAKKQFSAAVDALKISTGNFVNLAATPLIKALTDIASEFEATSESGEDLKDDIQRQSEEIAKALGGVVGAAQVLAAGFQASFNLAQIAFNGLAAGVADLAAAIAKSLSLITFGDVSRGFDEAATVLNNRATELKLKIDRDFQDINKSGDTLRSGFDRIVDSFSEVGSAADKNTASTNRQAEANKDVVVTLDEWNQAMLSGADAAHDQAAATGQATAAQEGLASATERTAQATGASVEPAGTLKEAYEQLGIVGLEKLQGIAAQSRANYQLLVDNNVPIQDQAAAWRVVAEAELAAARAAGEAESEQVRASLNSEAAASDHRKELERILDTLGAAGSAAEDFGNRAADGYDRATRSAERYNDEASRGSGQPSGARAGQSLRGGGGPVSAREGRASLSIADLTGLSDEDLRNYEQRVREAGIQNQHRPGHSIGFGESYTDIILSEIRKENLRRTGDAGLNRNAAPGSVRTIQVNFTRSDGRQGTVSLPENADAQAFLDEIEASGRVGGGFAT